MSRRTRSPHPGVVLERPEGEHATWRARFVDPDTERRVRVRLDPTVLGSKEARRQWAITKSRALAKRRAELESGAPRATGAALSEAVEAYFTAHPTLRKKTLDGYRAAAKKLLEWAVGVGVRSADDLNRARLMSFRSTLINEPKHAAAKGARRGGRRATEERRSAFSVNRELGALRTILRYLADADRLPKCSHEDLRRALKKLPTAVERLDFRKPAELRALLEAAIRHDAVTFAETREEHAGRRPIGTTVRYTPIAPLVAAAMLTGMRAGELVELEWRQVDLDALDNDGQRAGELHLSSATKTKRARTVDLSVSPMLRELLAAMQVNGTREGSVFNLTRGEWQAAEKRLGSEFGAPDGCNLQALRRTCGTFLTNAPGIFGAASAYRSAKQLGHSVTVAERHYVGVIRGIPREARTLEEAMGITAELERVIAAARAQV